MDPRGIFPPGMGNGRGANPGQNPNFYGRIAPQQHQQQYVQKNPAQNQHYQSIQQQQQLQWLRRNQMGEDSGRNEPAKSVQSDGIDASTMEQYIIKYHHGGVLLRERGVKYINGLEVECYVDPDKICYWDLLGDMKDIGYDVEKFMTNLFFVDSEGKLKNICNDQSTIALVDHLRAHYIVDIYVDSCDIRQVKNLPEAIRHCDEPVVELDALKVNEGLDGIMDNEESDRNSHSCDDDDDEGRLLDTQTDYNNSDVDEERDQGRDNVTKYLQLKRTIQENVCESDTDLGEGDEERRRVGTLVASDGKVHGYDSDYIESSDPGSYEETSEGSDADDRRRHKSTSKQYAPNEEFDDFCLGLSFVDLKQFKSQLVDFSTQKGFEFRYVKNDAVRVRARCSARGCEWLILCSWCSGKKGFVVKHYVGEHKCLLKASRNKRVTAHIVSKRFGDIICSMPFIKTSQLKVLVRRELGVFVTSKVCRNARGLVLKRIEAQFREDFKVLNNYANELKETNPGSTISVVSERKKLDECPVFQKMYICIAAVKQGFMAGCRRLIGLDGCFLKGLMKGQLLIAVGRDGNNQMFPIAWAIVDKETTESWTWFIEHLKVDLCIGEGLGWSVISDMQKGLIHAVNKLLPLIEHRMCARHIYARWGKKSHTKEFQLLFWSMARATNQPEVQKQLQNMRKLNGGEVAADELVERWPLKGWCQAFFVDVVKCEVVDNNMCETFNGVLLETRSKPIISLLEDIRQYIMKRMVAKRASVVKWKFECGPNIIRKIEKEKRESLRWQVEWNGGSCHEVFCDDPMQYVRQGYVVRLGNHACSCGKWDKSGIPCQHAIAVIGFCGADPINYLSEWFNKDTYLSAYQYNINPLRGREFWTVSEAGPMLPPIEKRMPGRPTKKRRRELLEGKNKRIGKISRAGRTMRCRICHVEGHNRLRCPNTPRTDTSDGIQLQSAPTITHDAQPLKRRDTDASLKTNVAKGKGNTNAASSGKKVRLTGSHGKISIFRGPHSGGVIVGRENPHGSSFITANKLITTRDERATGQSAQVEEAACQQASTTLEVPDLSTQRSIVG